MDKYVIVVIVALISGFVMAMVLPAFGFNLVGSVVFTAIAVALVSFQPVSPGAADVRENLRLAVLGAAIALILGSVVAYANGSHMWVGFIATIGATAVVNGVAAWKAGRKRHNL